VGMLTSRNPDTPEGLESRLSVEIHRILVELPHLTELELRKFCGTRMDFYRASALELLRGLPIRQDVLWPPEPHLSLYSTNNELGSTIGSETSLSSHFFVRRSTRVFIGGLSRCFGIKWGSGGPPVKLASQLGWSGGQVS
jgi:hypothetical protein